MTIGIVAAVESNPETERTELEEKHPDIRFAAAEQGVWKVVRGKIYVVIVLDNPDKYEILSFTLDGYKYQAYEFEKGSNSERLILKYETDDLGEKNCTLDGIKYVDGKDIKEVQMSAKGASQTVSMNIAEKETQPNLLSAEICTDVTRVLHNGKLYRSVILRISVMSSDRAVGNSEMSYDGGETWVGGWDFFYTKGCMEKITVLLRHSENGNYFATESIEITYDPDMRSWVA